MKYYCIGIKGSGMATLACILHDLGNEVSGYDDVVEHKFTQVGLDDRGIKIYHDSLHEVDKDTIVTYSVACGIDHKELVRLREQGLQIKKYNEILGDLTSMFETVCVSGTHGKTTTSTLITHILNNIYGCNYFIGDGSGYANLDNNKFVIESDEFNRHFLAYHPTYTVITNMELEHTEIYSDINDIVHTFEKFASETKREIVACGDNEYVRNADFGDKKVIYYGFNEENDVVAKNVKLSSNGAEFDYYKDNEYVDHFDLPLYGEHMVLNALAAITICILENVEISKIKELLKTFKNAKRRFAENFIGDIVTVDDYAHHPTEIKVTLEAAKQKYPDKELVVVFKPNTYSRTREFPKEFAEAMNVADYQYLTEIDCNREKPEDYGNVTSKIIFDGLNNGEMIDEDSVEKLLKHKNACVCFMSCASIAHIKDKYEELVKNN